MFRIFVISTLVLGSYAIDTSSRNLLERIESYRPKTIVTDYAALDLDLQLIQSELEKERESGFRIAQRVYQEGAFSRPVAELYLDQELESSIPAGAEVIGTAYDWETYALVKGTLHVKAQKGTRVLEILYDIRDDQENYVHCQAGANPNPFIDGCFAEEGTVQLTDSQISLEYSYDVRTQNFNYRSFQKESLYSRGRLYDCDNCPKVDYKKFVDYYGIYDYADHIIMRAFQSEETDMVRGSHDFGAFGWTGRRAIIQNSIVWLTMFMEVISRMERSIDECTDMGNPPDDALIFWDNAVAFYTGSQINDENGVFLFHLADSRCLSASTCGEDGNDNDGTAWVNFQVLRNFEAGQQHILERNCAATRKNKEEIVRLMTIPLIQGSLHRTRMLEDEEDNYERHAGEAAVYAASVLPFIHACSPDDAKIIHANLKASTSENGVDFEDVRNAFARNLPCLGITCDEIGDVLELDSNEGACLRAKSSMTATNGLEVESSNHTSAVILYSFLTIAAIAICYLAYKTSTNNRKQSIEKEITFRRSVSGSRLGDDRKFKAKDYVPQYWQDVENRRDGSNLKENQDEVVTGEML